MNAGSKKEWLICLAIAIGGVAVGAVFARPTPTAPVPAAPPKTAKPLGSAILTSPQIAKARPLLKGNSDYLNIWRSLDGCDNRQFEKLLEYSLTQPDGYQNAQLIAARWCEHDPAAATAAAAKLSNTMIFLASIETWASSDPFAAIDFLNEIPTNRIGWNAYSTVLNLVIEDQPRQLASLLEKIPGEHSQVRLSYELEKIAKRDPLTALQQLVEQRMPAGNYASERAWKNQMAWQLADAWIDQSTAREVLSFFDADTARKLGGVPPGLIYKLYEEDPEAALDWINEPSSPLRAAQYGLELATSFNEEKPEQAAAILTSLPEGKLRTREMIHLAKEWSKVDEEAARQWVDSLADEEIRSSLDQTEGGER